MLASVSAAMSTSLLPSVVIQRLQEGIAIGSGVVEAANKTLVTQRMKRSGMRWRIAWKALISATDTPANDNISPRAAAMAIAA